jgi:hypothetical protein
LWYDEAVNGVDIRMVLSGQGLPLYFAANGGREPLFIYLQAISVALFGPTPFSLRLVSALIGAATVAAVYACGRALFAPPRGASSGIDGRWAPVLAATALAVSYWHLSLSRLGLRAALLPLLSSFAILAFWHAWVGGRIRSYAWTGAWFGLSLYTYTSARVLPLVPALFILSEIVAARVRRQPAPDAEPTPKSRTRGLALALLVALLVSAPLLVELARHPVTVVGRIGDVAASETNGDQNFLTATAANGVRMLRAFYDRGDPNPRHNLPGRPATDPLTAALFTAGLLLALLRVRERRARLLLIWFGVMLLPSVLSGAAPHYLRAVGALPPYALLAGYGGTGLAGLAPARVRRWATPALAGLVLIGSGALTARDYFVRWPTEPALAKEFSVDQQAAAENAAAALLGPNGGATELPDALFRTPNMVYRLGRVTEQIDATDAPGVNMDVRGGEPMWRLTSNGTAVEAQLARASGEWQPEVPLNLAFANGISLVGYDVQPAVSVAASAPVTLTLYWLPSDRLNEEAAASSEVFTHLVAGGAVRATDNGPLSDNYRLVWPALRGLLVDTRVFSAPADAPPGKAYFEVGQYARKPWEPYTAARRIPLVDGAGNTAGDQVIVAPVMLATGAPAADPGRLAPLAASFEERIALFGWQLTAGAGAADMTARFCWRAERRLPTDLTAFVHLLDAGDAIVSQFDAAPGGVDNPTSRWVPGETACTEHPLAIPASGLTDEHRLRVGLYEPVSGRQWSVSAAGLAAPATYLILRPENDQ